MACRFDKRSCIREGCSEWECAYLKTPEECQHWIPEAKITRPVILMQPEN
jgi:hypothetical protein